MMLKINKTLFQNSIKRICENNKNYKGKEMSKVGNIYFFVVVIFS